MKDLRFNIRAKDDTRQGFDSANRRAKGFSASMAQAGQDIVAAGRAAQMFAGGALVAGLAGFANLTRRAVDEITQLGAAARTAGVSFEAFQELKYAAEANLVSVDALQDGLKELQLRADELVRTGAGPAAEAFGRLGYSAEELADALREPDVLFQQVMDRMREFDRAAQIRIADELFGGTGGEQFVRMLDEAGGSMSELRQQARDLGAVYSQEMLVEVEEINRAWNQMTTIVGVNLKAAAIETLQVFLRIGDAFRAVESRFTDSLQNQLTETYDTLNAAKRDLAEMQSGGVVWKGLVPSTSAEEDVQRQIALVEELTAKALTLRDELDRRQGYSPDFVFEPETPKADDSGARFMEEYRRQLAATNREREIAAETSRILADAGARGASITREQAAALAEESVRRSEADAAAKEYARTTEKQTDAINGVLAALDLERQSIGLSAVEQRVLNELTQAGVTAESQYGQAIAARVRQNEAAIEANRALTQAQEDFNGSVEYLQDSAFDAFWSFTEGADSAMDAVKRLAMELAKAAVYAALFNRGPLAGLIGGGGGLLGGMGLGGGGSAPFVANTSYGGFLGLPGFAEGGSFRVGGGGGTDSQLVAFRASPDETVTISTPEQASAAAAGSVDVRITVDDEGRIAAAIDRKSRQAAGQVVRQAAPALIGASKAATFKDLASGKGDAMLRGRYGVKPVVSPKT